MLSKLFICHLRNIENNIYPLFPLSYSNSFFLKFIWLFFFIKLLSPGANTFVSVVAVRSS